MASGYRISTGFAGTLIDRELVVEATVPEGVSAVVALPGAEEQAAPTGTTTFRAPVGATV